MYKYKYTGLEPVTLTTLNIEVNPGDVITVDEPINSVLFVLVKDQKATKEATN